jgi:hypothetical protein
MVRSGKRKLVFFANRDCRLRDLIYQRYVKRKILGLRNF